MFQNNDGLCIYSFEQYQRFLNGPSNSEEKSLKSKDLQQVALPQVKKGEAPKKLFSDLNGAVEWFVRPVPSICYVHVICNGLFAKKNTIQTVKRKSKNGKTISCRRLALEMHMSCLSVYRILEHDLHLRAYKKLIEPLLNDEHKDDTLRVVFSDEKMFDLDGIYHSQNDRIWATDREKANRKGGIKQRRKFPQKVMVWLAAC